MEMAPNEHQEVGRRLSAIDGVCRVLADMYRDLDKAVGRHKEHLTKEEIVEIYDFRDKANEIMLRYEDKDNRINRTNEEYAELSKFYSDMAVANPNGRRFAKWAGCGFVRLKFIDVA